jgi:uncharacterized protein
MTADADGCTIETPAGPVSGLLALPDAPIALYVLAHGAGAGMRHPFLTRVAERLSAEKIGTLRYQFPYMELGKGRTDPPTVAAATVRAAVEFARGRCPAVPLVAGGKSFGGRMTSTAFAEQPLHGVHGLVFLGFPLHPPRKPAVSRAEHLERVGCPMLFLQGTRDDLADLSLLRPLVDRLGPRATLRVVDGADHSFSVLKSSGRTNAEVMSELVGSIAAWTRAVAQG